MIETRIALESAAVHPFPTTIMAHSRYLVGGQLLDYNWILLNYELSLVLGCALALGLIGTRIVRSSFDRSGNCLSDSKLDSCSIYRRSSTTNDSVEHGDNTPVRFILAWPFLNRSIVMHGGICKMVVRGDGHAQNPCAVRAQTASTETKMMMDYHEWRGRRERKRHFDDDHIERE